METKKYKCSYKKNVKCIKADSYDILRVEIGMRYCNLPSFSDKFILQYEDDDGTFLDIDSQEDLEVTSNRIRIVFIDEQD